MAIDRIPGVGPANSDIAAATAAVVPNSAAITAAVPTAAQIATAVAAPSAATIATAVAAPSAATIASAVAAPSSATIATAVAAAVPTIGAINTSVANNASPYGGTWANLADVVTPGTSSVTISGLGGYKYLQIYFSFFGYNTVDSLRMRFNSDATGVYHSISAGTGGTIGAISESSFGLMPSTNTGRYTAMLEIRGSNSSSIKMYSGFAWGTTGNLGTGFSIGTYNSNTAISSINLFTGSGNIMDSGGRVLIRGAN
jgi:hypothetical protein